jgi:DNA-binding PadR family transcriptional regulator
MKQDRIITGKEKDLIETEMGLLENLEKGFIRISKIVDGVKYYSITKKGEKHIKSLVQQ